jgi:hypothetical protein
MTRTLTRGRRPLSKTMLLPLATAHVQRLQLKHHVALAVVRDGKGEVAQIATLFNALYLAFHLRDVADVSELALYQRAEAVLHAYTERAEQDEWFLTGDERAVLEQLLIVHDAQLAEVPMHRYVDAMERLAAFDQSGGDSPIPVPTG